MPISTDVIDKVKKNIIVHYYEYNSIDQQIEQRIKELEAQIVELRKQQDCRINIFVPSQSDILEKNILRPPAVVEFTSTFVDQNTNQPRQKRELVYVEKIQHNADFTAVFDREGEFITDFSNESYKKLVCYSFGKKSIVRISGREGKD